MSDARCEAVIVAIADLFGGHRVVLIDDWNHVAIEKSSQRAACIQKSPPVFGVFGRQEHLRGCDAVMTQHFLVRMHELHLARCRGGLQVLKTGTALVDAQNRTADRNGTGRDDQDLVLLFQQGSDILSEGFKPGSIQLAVFVHEQR